jgi:hypothetical protein
MSEQPESVEPVGPVEPVDPADSSEAAELEMAPEKPARRSRIFWIVGLGVLVLALVGAAFWAGRLLNPQTGPVASFGPLGAPGGGMAVQSVQIDMGEPPAELPLSAPDVAGSFVKRSDNILTVGTFTGQGSEGVVVVEGASGGAQLQTQGNNGPQQEVVVTQSTKIYRDATFDDLKGGMPDTSQKIQQKVAEASLDEIGTMSMIRAWGRKSGDRIIADVLFFSSPIIFQKGDGN